MKSQQIAASVLVTALILVVSVVVVGEGNGFQTRNGEMVLARMVGGLADR